LADVPRARNDHWVLGPWDQARVRRRSLARDVLFLASVSPRVEQGEVSFNPTYSSITLKQA